MSLRLRPLATIVVGFVLAAFAMPAINVAQPPDKKDAARDLPVLKPIEPKKDPKTGFVVGGKNGTALLRKLTEINGVPIAKLEKAMRPGALSRLGFLGKDEKLLDILAGDNHLVVEEWGQTHQQLAWHLRVLGRIGEVYEAIDLKLLPAANLAKHLSSLGAVADKHGKEFTYQGSRFKIKITAFRGIVDSPFDDETKTNKAAALENLTNGKKLEFSLLVPLMIERYGFYEGHGTPYRVDPRKVVEVCDFLRKARKE